MHPFLNEIPISLRQLSTRKHMAEQANLPRDALSLGHEISDGRVEMNQMLSNAATGTGQPAGKRVYFKACSPRVG